MKTYGTEASVDDGAIEIGIAEYAVTPNGAELSTFGLGSCVAVALYEPDSGVSALAHVMLPRQGGNDDSESLGKFADTAVKAMLSEMAELGADRGEVRAKVVGGSEMFDFSGIAEGVGRRNVEAVKRELDSQDIPIEAEDVGGDHGRSVRFDGATGTLVLKTAEDGETEL
jgi:chemotaxis protein CheD